MNQNVTMQCLILAAKASNAGWKLKLPKECVQYQQQTSGPKILISLKLQRGFVLIIFCQFFSVDFNFKKRQKCSVSQQCSLLLSLFLKFLICEIFLQFSHQNNLVHIFFSLSVDLFTKLMHRLINAYMLSEALFNSMCIKLAVRTAIVLAYKKYLLNMSS